MWSLASASKHGDMELSNRCEQKEISMYCSRESKHVNLTMFVGLKIFVFLMFLLPCYQTDSFILSAANNIINAPWAIKAVDGHIIVPNLMDCMLLYLFFARIHIDAVIVSSSGVDLKLELLISQLNRSQRLFKIYAFLGFRMVFIWM